jgi:DnaT-like ssDNA binding protein
MSLVIETGAGLANAQSYASVADLRAHAILRSASVPAATPAGDSACETLLVKAMDFLETQNFVGTKLTRAQSLQWPRAGACAEAWPIPTNEIPRQLIQAQCALAIEAQTVDLLPTTDANASGPIISETVGPVTTAYANPSSVRRVPAVAKADALLRTLLKRNGLVAIRS